MKEIITGKRLGESYTRIKHSSGLTMVLCPMKEYSSAYALFATEYGSIDNCFKTQNDDDFVCVPDGIAHFLEHKMFENEDGDAFALYAKTGASANAYTSFDRTAYLFSCSDNFKESLDILLDFVSRPYFTQKSVEKEQGIIGQEIKMYDDNPDWRVYFNLLSALYVNNPVRVDIAGTVESISKIDADLLYRCYNTFYNLNNMVLAIAGNFDIDTVLEAADKILKPAKPITIERKLQDEPLEVAQKRIEQRLPVAMPMFQVGFKGVSEGKKENILNQIYDEILLDVIAGEATPLYRKLYDAGLINSTFTSEVLAGRDYIANIFAGEGKDPDAVYDAICKEIERIKHDGISDDAFTQSKRAVYGRYIGMYARVESVASVMLLSEFSDINMYELLDIAANVTKEQLEARLKKSFDVSKTAISIVLPSEDSSEI